MDGSHNLALHERGWGEVEILTPGRFTLRGMVPVTHCWHQALCAGVCVCVCVSVCDLETSIMKRSRDHLGRCATRKTVRFKESSEKKLKNYPEVQVKTHVLENQ